MQVALFDAPKPPPRFEYRPLAFGHVAMSAVPVDVFLTVLHGSMLGKLRLRTGSLAARSHRPLAAPLSRVHPPPSTPGAPLALGVEGLAVRPSHAPSGFLCRANLFSDRSCGPALFHLSRKVGPAPQPHVGGFQKGTRRVNGPLHSLCNSSGAGGRGNFAGEFAPASSHTPSSKVPLPSASGATSQHSRRRRRL